MDESMNKVMAGLQFNITPALTQLQTIAEAAEKSAITAKEAFTKTNLTVAASVNAQQMTAQQAMAQSILAESEARKVAITAKGQAEISAVTAKEALTRQSIIEKEAKTELIAIQQANEKMKQSYMQARTAAFSENAGSFGDLVTRHASWAIAGLTIYGTFELLKESLVDVETGMKGLQTVIPELHESQDAYNQACEETIDLMQKLGSDLDESMTSARSFGRMYKDVETVMGLTNNAILLNVIDQVALEDAVKGNEVTLSTYGETLKNTNDVLAFSGKLMDSITILSHNTLATGTDLVNILQQTSSAAKQAGTDLDELLGLGSASIRATGLQGQGGNIGRMLRTVFTQLSAPTDNVEETIEKIGVKMRTANGELRNAYDIILDLSLATKDATLSQEELNDAMLKASSGKFQYNKLSALVGQFDDIVKNTAMSINSQGQTLEMAGQQLDTVSRKAGQLRATLIDLFNGAGDSGLRDALKDMIDGVNQFIMGLEKVNPKVYQFGFQLLEVVIAYKAFMAVSGMLAPLLTTIGAGMQYLGIVTEVTATATKGAAVAQEGLNVAMAKSPITLLITALSALAGVALYQYISKLGEAEKAQLDLNQVQEDEISIASQKASQATTAINYLETLKSKHKELSDAINSGKLNAQELEAAQENLKAVDEAVLILTDAKTREQLKSNGVTEEEIQLVIDSQIASKNAALSKIEDQKKLTDATVEQTLKRIEALEQENALWMQMSGNTPVSKNSFLSGMGGNDGGGFLGAIDAENNLLEQQRQKAADLAASIITAKGEIAGLQHSSDGSGSGSGDKSSNDWVQNYLDSILTYAEAQAKLNEANSRAMDIENAKIGLMTESSMTMAEYIEGMGMQSAMAEKLEQQQEGIHTEADLYRAAIVALEAKQKTLNTSTEDGQDAYSKISDEIENCRQKVDELGISYVGLKGKQRAIYGSNIKEVLGLFDRMKDLGVDTTAIEGQYLSTVNLENATLSDKLDLLKRIEDYVKNTATAAIDEKIASVQSLKDAYDTASDARIASIQDEIDALQEEQDEEEELQSIEEAREAVAEARLNLKEAEQKLENVQNEKNTRLYENGVWTYIADPDAVKDAQDEVDDANSALIDAKESLYDLLEEIARKHEETELQAQIDAEKKKREETDAYYDKQIKDLKSQADNIVQTMLAGGDQFKETITTIFQEKLTPEMQTQLDLLGAMVSNWVSEQMTEINSVMGLTGKNVTPTGSHAAGGYIPNSEIAQLHGNEYVLNSPTVNALGGKIGVESLISSLRFPGAVGAGSIVRSSTSTTTTSVDKGVHLHGDVKLDHIYDVSGFIRNMKALAG